MGEETLWVYRVHNCIDRLAFEWPPYYGTISDSEFSHTKTGEDSSFRYFESVHDGNDEVAASACAFNILQELRGHEIVHVAPHERRVQGDLAFQIIKKKHGEKRFRGEAKISMVSEWAVSVGC